MVRSLEAAEEAERVRDAYGDGGGDGGGPTALAAAVAEERRRRRRRLDVPPEGSYAGEEAAGGGGEGYVDEATELAKANHMLQQAGFDAVKMRYEAGADGPGMGIASLRPDMGSLMSTLRSLLGQFERRGQARPAMHCRTPTAN